MAQRLIDSSKYAVLAAAYASEVILPSPSELSKSVPMGQTLLCNVSLDVKYNTKIDHASVGGYRTKTVRAGEFLYISCYPLISCNANREQRKRLEEMQADREKNVKLRVKYDRYNNKRRCMEFEQTAHASFNEGDLHICCTYDMQDYSRLSAVEYITREQAQKDIRNYLRRLRYLLKKHGCDLKEFRWICVTVTKESMKEAVNPRPDRHHHHLLVHGVPDYLRNEAENLWTLGYCNADRLRYNGKGIADMAAYVARQETSFNGENGGARSYTTSRNIIRPTVTTSDSRLSRRRAALIAADVRMNGQEIFETLFKGYRMSEDAKITVSDFTAGAYIYAKLRRIDSKQQNRPRRTPSRMIA